MGESAFLQALKTGEGKFQLVASDGTVIGDLKTSDLRDALVGTGNKSLTDLYNDLESLKAQHPASLTTAGNFKVSLEEQAIALGVDIQARYPLKTVREITPTATGTYWLPETGSIDLSNFLASTWYIYAPSTTGMVINCHLNISHDGGTTFRRVAGYSIADADFVRGQWNSIHCPLMLAEAKLEVVIENAYPSELDLMVIRKA